MRHRYDWKALQDRYVQGDDDLTLETLAAGAGLNVKRIKKRADEENWEFMQARWCVYMGRPQKTDILKRCRADWDKKCAEAWKKVAEARKRELEAKYESGK